MVLAQFKLERLVNVEKGAYICTHHRRQTIKHIPQRGKAMQSRMIGLTGEWCKTIMIEACLWNPFNHHFLCLYVHASAFPERGSSCPHIQRINHHTTLCSDFFSNEFFLLRWTSILLIIFWYSHSFHKNLHSPTRNTVL